MKKQWTPEQLRRLSARQILHTQAWRDLSKVVVAEEPLCKLALPGCTGLSEQGDHIIPLSVDRGLALTRTNVQGACGWCNGQRQNRDISSLRAPRALAFFE